MDMIVGLTVEDGQSGNSSDSNLPDTDYGYVTLYRHDFDAQDAYWHWDLKRNASGTIRDGYAFLNMTDETTSNASSRVIGWETHPTRGRASNDEEGQWLYASMEIRLKCSDDNLLESEKGGGMRAWGLVNYQEWPEDCLLFLSWSPGSIQEKVGFWIEVKIGDRTVLREPLTGIDMTEWHTYTILWEVDNSTFLVDGHVVGTVNRSPTVPLFGDVFLENLYHGVDEEHSGSMDITSNVSLQVDYVRLFASEERFEAWSQEISHAEELIDQAEKEGIDTTELAGFLDEVKNIWREGYYNHNFAKLHLDMIIPYLENFDEISEMFSSCAALIERSKQEGVASRTITVMEGIYSQAERDWGEYNYAYAKSNLQRIIDMVDQEG